MIVRPDGSIQHHGGIVTPAAPASPPQPTRWILVRSGWPILGRPWMEIGCPFCEAVTVVSVAARRIRCTGCQAMLRGDGWAIPASVKKFGDAP